MPHPLEPFERIYVVNLASRADRRREMSRQLAGIGLDLEVLPVERFDAVRPDAPGGFTSIGSHGCYLSHLGILRKAQADGLETILVLEDDVDFVDDFAVRAASALQRLRNESWSVFYGGGRLDAPPRAAQAGGCVALAPDEGVGTTYFYGLRGAVIGDLADYLEKMLHRPPGDADGGPMHVDGAYCWFRKRRPQYRTLLAVPELGCQRPSRTDVHPLRWYDRSVGVREAMTFLRRVRRGWDGMRSGGRA